MVGEQFVEHPAVIAAGLEIHAGVREHRRERTVSVGSEQPLCHVHRAIHERDHPAAMRATMHRLCKT